MAYVYKHIRLDTNKIFYIGIGKSKKRLTSKHFRNRYWNNIVNKVGFVAEILFENLTWEEACEKEKELIKFYGRKDLKTGILVNMTDGGEGANNFSKKTRETISNKLHGNKLSEETKKKISNSNKGKRMSEEAKIHLSKILKGHKLSDETKRKISESLTGRKLEKKTIQKIIKTRKENNKPPHNKGKKFNKTTRKYF